MSSFILSVYLLNQNEWYNHEKVRRRIMRDHSNPLDLPQPVFIAYYRVNKESFKNILDDVKPLIKPSSIPAELKLAASLRFFAEGGFQRSIGKDTDIALGRSTVSKILTEMLNILEKVLCPKWIKLKMSPDEVRRSKDHFYNSFGIPGIIGCIDGTHVKLLKPQENEHLFFNRKGYFSVNALIICDYQMLIRAVDACHPGSSHDAFIFNLSKAKQYFLSRYEDGDRNSRLLGDSGYGLEPFLLTPYRNAIAGTMQHKYNLQHSKARNIVERVIGVLKSRFKCLQSSLPYTPQKVVKICNVCCALHNICRLHNVNDIADDCVLPVTEVINDELMFDESNSSLLVAGQTIRDEIANNIMLTL